MVYLVGCIIEDLWKELLNIGICEVDFEDIFVFIGFVGIKIKLVVEEV